MTILMDSKIIGNNIRKLRKKEQLTQAQLAEAIDKSTIHVSHMENGLTNISIDCLLALCAALKTTPNTILQGTYYIPSAENHNLLTDSNLYQTHDSEFLAREIADLVVKKLESR